MTTKRRASALLDITARYARRAGISALSPGKPCPKFEAWNKAFWREIDVNWNRIEREIREIDARRGWNN